MKRARVFDTAGLLLGFQQKLASVAAGPLKEELYNYPLEDAEPTLALKHMDQIPPSPEDKLQVGGSPCGGEGVVEKDAGLQHLIDRIFKIQTEAHKRARRSRLGFSSGLKANAGAGNVT